MQNTKGPFVGIRRKGARGTIPGLKYLRNSASIATKCGKIRVFVAVLGRRAQHCLLYAVASPSVIYTSWILDLGTRF